MILLSGSTGKEINFLTRSVFSVLFSLIFQSVHSQNDSLFNAIRNEPAGKKARILLSESKKTTGTVSGYLAAKSFSYAQQSGEKELIASTGHRAAAEYFNTGKTDSAKYFNEKVLEALEQLPDVNHYPALILRSKILMAENNPSAALENNKKLLNYVLNTGNDTLTARAYVEMANLFSGLGDNQKAITYLDKALHIFTENGSVEGREITLMNLGVAYSARDNTKAIGYFEKALKENEISRNTASRSNILNNLAAVYYDRSELVRALELFRESLALKKASGGSNEIDLNNNIGAVMMELERYKEARPYLEAAFAEAKKNKGKSHVLLSAAYNLSELSEAEGDYKKALDYLDYYTDLNDSLTAAQNAIMLSEIEAKYQNEKKEQQNVILKENLRSKNLQVYFALAALALLAGLAFFAIRNYSLKKRANIELEAKSRIIQEKSTLVEEQNKDITDSINYAQRIQQAILPPDKLWNSILPHSFVFYQPKNVLSGDFYWIEETKDHIFIAAADCTGHGVPGALMSVLNYNLLNKAVLEQGLIKAGAILDGVNRWLTDSLHQTFQESQVKDGMDVSLCVINKKTSEINYSGAFNSIYVINEQSLVELLTDKQPVGAFVEDNVKPFTDKFYQLKRNDVVYMFTDGFTDQFGGEKGKKFKHKNLQKLLLNINQKPFAEQKELAATGINSWKGNLEQVDDMLLLGFKII